MPDNSEGILECQRVLLDPVITEVPGSAPNGQLFLAVHSPGGRTPTNRMARPVAPITEPRPIDSAITPCGRSTGL